MVHDGTNSDDSLKHTKRAIARMETMTSGYKITSKAQIQYCPLCGAKTRSEEFEVAPHRTNVRVVCDEHGEIYI